jgi:hypothetical protein
MSIERTTDLILEQARAIYRKRPDLDEDALGFGEFAL